MVGDGYGPVDTTTYPVGGLTTGRPATPSVCAAIASSSASSRLPRTRAYAPASRHVTAPDSAKPATPLMYTGRPIAGASTGNVTTAPLLPSEPPGGRTTAVHGPSNAARSQRSNVLPALASTRSMTRPATGARAAGSAVHRS